MTQSYIMNEDQRIKEIENKPIKKVKTKKKYLLKKHPQTAIIKKMKKEINLKEPYILVKK